VLGLALTGCLPGATPRPSPALRDIVALPGNSGAGQRIVYRNGTQQVWVVDGANRVIDTYRVSGRLGVPRPGTYHVYQKQLSGRDNTGTLALPYFIVFTGNIGFHAIPIDRYGRPVQSDAQLGQPLSHGCVRLRRDKAAFLWNWAGIGTTVVVV
jgi:hypothetical protein